MIFWLKLYAIVLAVFAVLDFAWLTAMKGFYRSQLAGLMADRVNWPPAIVFYLLFAAGLVVFVLTDAGTRGLGATIALGAFFGLVTYGTYDLTNFATLTRWPAALTMVDMAWGTLLSAVAAGAGHEAMRWMAPA